MPRYCADWLSSFIEYAGYGEAPPQMYFWTGVSTLAGALRRKVWIDQTYFTWYPNFYIVLVAPPGIVSKSTTANIGMNLLREIPDIKFGPDIVTPQALVEAFTGATESFEYASAYHPMSPLTLAASEFGNLLDTRDAMMVNLLIELWDGNKKLDKRTKMSGNNLVDAPWINLIACTTPAWLAQNFSENMVGGGLMSRMVFVYAEKKEHFVAYPSLNVPKDHNQKREKLVADLMHIASRLVGPMRLSPGAVEWGTAWYRSHWEDKPKHLDDDRYGGYVARKQTHLHKLAMILAVSRSDDLEITAEDLATANELLTSVEGQMAKIFDSVGRSEISVQMERFLLYCKKRQKLSYEEAYRYIHAHFPGSREFEDMVLGCIKSGQLKLETLGGKAILTWIGGD